MQRDLTSGCEWKVILAFSLPMMGSMLLQTLYTLVDSIIVGNFISSSALGAIGTTGAVVMLATLICQGVGTGGSIAVAQFYGAKRHKDITEMLSTAVLVGGALAILMTVCFILLSKPLITGFLQTPPEITADSIGYFRWICVGILFQMLYNIVYGVLRAHGDSRGAVQFLLVAAVLNLALDCLFVIVFRWGVAGAAIATIISQAGCAVAACIYLYRLFPSLRLGRKDWKIHRKQIILLLKLSVPIILQSSVTAVGFIVLQRLVNSFGQASIEGFIAMQKVENLMHIPGNAFGIAIAGFVGQNIGAGKIDRAQRGYLATAAINLAVCMILAVGVFLMAQPAIGLFNVQGDSLQRGVEHLRLICCFMVFTSLNHVTSGFLQGTGDVRFPAIASFVNLSIRVVSAYIMARTWIDYRSIYYSLPLAWVTVCTITQWRYWSGAWRNKAVVKMEA